MTIGVVQTVSTEKGSGGPWNSVAVTIAAPTAGNTLVLVVGCEQGTPNRSIVLPAGWTQRDNLSGSHLDMLTATKVATGSEGTITVQFSSAAHPTGGEFVQRTTMDVLEINGTFDTLVAGTEGSSGTSLTAPSVTPTAGTEVELVGVWYRGNAHAINTYPSGYTTEAEEVANTGASERMLVSVEHVASASGSYTGTATYAGGANRTYSVQLWLSAFPAISVSISVDHSSGDEPLTVTFTGTPVGGSPSAWLWTFGDGATSTTATTVAHAYAAGSWTATLDVTIGGNHYTDSIDISVFIDVGFEDPPPANAVVEIYAAEPGAARWDDATWDDDVWSSAGWQDVTPQSIDATIRWGSTRPELGILSQPEAGTWNLTIYDPDRILDPSNVSGQFYGDLVPGLPVRVSHRGLVVRQGTAESIGHSFITDPLGMNGYMRVTDYQAVLSQAKVPSTSTLANTLWARAQDAIEAAGIAVYLGPAPATDPALIAWVTGTDRTVWEWIADAAQQVLYVPLIDRLGNLTFRSYTGPMRRARSIRAPNLIDLQALSEYNGLFSVVQALDSSSVVQERAVTPPPDYGKRTFARTDKTPNAATWAQAVLDDRALPALRWVPGDVYPLSALDVEYFATIEALEMITVGDAYTNPVVNADVIVVGGEIRVIAKDNAEALWRFRFEAAQTATQPLVSDADSVTYLTRDDDTTVYLYPDT